MCIRDSLEPRDRHVEALGDGLDLFARFGAVGLPGHQRFVVLEQVGVCLLYTSDAADERSSVDLGGRRIIKKKKEANKRIELDHTKKKKKTRK